MAIENLPSRAPPDFGKVRDPGRPVLSYPWRAAHAHRVPAHRHERGHILLLEEGAYRVTTDEGTWLVPTGQAIWIPPRVRHAVSSRGAVAARILFVDAACAGPLPDRAGTVEVNPLLAELVVRAVDNGNDYPPDSPAARLAQVVLDELARTRIAPLMLPYAHEPRLARVMEALLADPGSRAGVADLAKRAGTSPRTLARLFVEHTGMTLSQWRTRLVLVEAIERIARGASVTEVAFDLGYGPSSLAHVFRANLGVSPAHYRERVRPSSAGASKRTAQGRGSFATRSSGHDGEVGA